mmetsp:Transcript_31180/g.85460  ORF Transcript_31180/g.85460 Transcript_31180/m.85460 type:complete len:221 (-) Transcript_31180:1811-2473(-)
MPFCMRADSAANFAAKPPRGCSSAATIFGPGPPVPGDFAASAASFARLPAEAPLGVGVRPRAAKTPGGSTRWRFSRTGRGVLAGATSADAPAASTRGRLRENGFTRAKGFPRCEGVATGGGVSAAAGSAACRGGVALSPGRAAPATAASLPPSAPSPSRNPSLTAMMASMSPCNKHMGFGAGSSSSWSSSGASAGGSPGAPGAAPPCAGPALPPPSLPPP